jgi:folate-binding protein YgfZ
VAATDRTVADYRVLTEACGLLDRSERGKLALTGTGAKEFLEGQVTNAVEALSSGQGVYAAFLSPKGKMLGDLRVLDLGDELFLDTERSVLQELFNMIRRYRIGYDMDLHKRTVERGLLSLIGPEARAVAGAGDLPRAEHANAPGEVDGTRVRLVATDAGVDLICDAADTDALAAELRGRGAEDVDEAAAEVLRVEAGRPRYGVDLDDTVIPQEAGLNERAVSFTKGCYVGQETVARLHYRGKRRSSRPATAPSRLLWSGARHSRAPRWRSEAATRRPTSSSSRSENRELTARALPASGSHLRRARK